MSGQAKERKREAVEANSGPTFVCWGAELKGTAHGLTVCKCSRGEGRGEGGQSRVREQE